MENGSFDDVVPIENEDIPIFRAYVRLPDGTFKSSFTTLKWNFLHLEKTFPFKKQNPSGSIMFLEPKWPLFSWEKDVFLD